MTLTTFAPKTDDTIAALASPPGLASRGIVRVSGPLAKEVVEAVFVAADRPAWNHAQTALRHPGRVNLPGVQCPLRVDVLLWPTNRSYTGQPAAELHAIGSPPLLESLLQQLFVQGARPAQRGEFTLRAFLAGRLDLVQAEGVLGVIEATDEQQLCRALQQLGGGLSDRMAALHEQLLLHLADLEAGLDFVEEEIEFVSRDVLSARIETGMELLTGLMSQSVERLQSTGRRRVVLAGLPNAGKSTLFNALSDEPAAIVSQTAGTTRDFLNVPLDWDGLAIELVDTAGWDPNAGVKDQQSIDRAADEMRDDQWQRADLILWCTSADISPVDHASDARLRRELERRPQPLVRVTTKCDLIDSAQQVPGIAVSAATGASIDVLKDSVIAQLQSSNVGNQLLGTTAARCRESLRGATDALARARHASMIGLGDEIIAVELREAIDHLGQIVGRVFTDDILDRIFSRFCIGK